MRGCAWIHSRGTASAGGVDPGFLRSIGGRGQVEDSIRRGPAHPDSSRISPLARDGERGWGVELDHLRPGIKRGRPEVSTTVMNGFIADCALLHFLRREAKLPAFSGRLNWLHTMFLFDQSESMLRVVLQRSEPHLGEHIQLAASDKRRIFSQNYKEIVKKHAMGPVHNHQVVEMRVQRLDPAHAQRAHGAPPQADTLPLNRPPGLLPLLQQPQPNGMPPYTPNGPPQMFFTGIGPPYPFPFLPPQPQSDGVLPQFPPQFPPGIFPFRPNLPGLPQWPQTIVPLGPMTVFEEKVIVTALFDAGFRGVTPKVALDALHGTQGIPAHVWKDRYLDHKEGFDALVCSLRASANPGPTAVPNPPFPQGNTTAPAAATTKTPIYSRTEQAPESKGRPSVYPSRSTPPASVNVRTVKKPHYPRIKQSPESESESEGKSSSARPARSAAKLQSKALNQPSRGRTTMNSLTAHTAVYTKKLPPPSQQIRIPKTPSKEPTPPTGLTTQTSPTKFTDEEEDFFIGFILWSLQQDPVLLGAVSPCRTSAPPCNNLLNTLLHCGTRFADPGWYRAHDALLRMDPLARDDERGWGGSWLPAFDWRARAGRGFNSARARSSRFLTNLTTRAGWRARSCSAQCRLAGTLPRLVTTCSTHCCIAELDLLILDGTERTMRCCAWIHSRGTTSAGGVDPGCLRSIGGRGQVEDSIRRGPAHPDSSRISPLARDGERGWGVELDHLRSTASAGSLTIYAGWWRASSFEDSAGPAKLCMDMVQLLQARVAQRSDPESQCEGNREHFLRQTLGTAPKLFFVSPAASTPLFARISAHREGPGPAAGRFVAGFCSPPDNALSLFVFLKLDVLILDRDLLPVLRSQSDPERLQAYSCQPAVDSILRCNALGDPSHGRRMGFIDAGLEIKSAYWVRAYLQAGRLASFGGQSEDFVSEKREKGGREDSNSVQQHANLIALTALIKAIPRPSIIDLLTYSNTAFLCILCPQLKRSTCLTGVSVKSIPLESELQKEIISTLLLGFIIYKFNWAFLDIKEAEKRVDQICKEAEEEKTRVKSLLKGHNHDDIMEMYLQTNKELKRFKEYLSISRLDSTAIARKGGIYVFRDKFSFGSFHRYYKYVTAFRKLGAAFLFQKSMIQHRNRYGHYVHNTNANKAVSTENTDREKMKAADMAETNYIDLIGDLKVIFVR
ncbi:hypothetical protein C8R43DRAFT_1132406 [Mycena crocata]|nr:hypothetical protein C8R43DRAFT_1132406 [Mycena crocata]